MRKVFILVTIWIFISGRCPTKEELKFERNPNLELFLTDTTLDGHEEHYFSPVWAPSGDKIYCILRENISLGGSTALKHRLISVDINTKEIDTLVKDSVMMFALSKNGDYIAYVKSWPEHAEYSENPLCSVEAKIIVIDAITGNIKHILDPVVPYIFDIEYASNDSFLVFLGYDDTSSTGFYSINVYTNAESLITKTSGKLLSFTLNPENDTLIFNDEWWYPEFNPLFSNQIVVSLNINITDLSENEDILLIDLSNSKTVHLNAKPYYYTDIGKISWHQNGKKIIFSAAKPWFPERVAYDRQELWILNLE